MAVLAIVALAARVQTFGDPVLGFDEQFYLLVGDRMLHGMVPFVDIFDRKPIGLFLIYAGVRLLGGDGFVQYKLVATCFAAATACGVFHLARRQASVFAALAAGAAYLLWLDFMEGEGGQAPVFYNLPMVAAAAAVMWAADGTGRTRRAGLATMAAIGLAMQIKYSVVVEGVYLGCALLWLGWRDRESAWRLTASAALWVGCAMLPTALAFAWYAADGHAREFVFCNFTSVFGQRRRPIGAELAGLAGIAGILSPLLVGVAAARPWRGGHASVLLMLGWLVAAAVALLAYARFDSPHYGLPLLAPACVLVAPVLDGARGRRLALLGSLCALWVAGQTVLAVSERLKGGRGAAMAVAEAARPGRGCIYVHDGYPALYMLTGSCLQTRWPFPGHLATRDEATPAAIGVDAVAEVRRILASRPVAIVDDYPPFEFGNPATRRVLERVLAADYRLVACVRTGPSRTRLVYRRNAGNAARPPASCPAVLTRR